MPQMTRAGNGARKAASSPGGTTVKPRGLLKSEATLATSLLVARPTEQGSPVSAGTRSKMVRAVASAPSQPPAST